MYHKVTKFHVTITLLVINFLILLEFLILVTLSEHKVPTQVSKIQFETHVSLEKL